MDCPTSRYELRIIEIQNIRNQYLFYLKEEIDKLKISKFIVSNEYDYTFDWVLEEALMEILSCKVDRHYACDLSKCLYFNAGFVIDMITEAIRPTDLLYRKDKIDHIKVMTVGHTLIIAVLFKESK